MSEIDDFQRSLDGYNNLQGKLVDVLNVLASANYHGRNLTNSINGAISINNNDVRFSVRNRETVDFIKSIIGYMRNAVIPYTYDSAVNAAREIDRIHEEENE